MKSIIKSDRVRLGEAQPSARPATPTAGHHPGRAVELVRADGRVHALRVTCTCGESTVVEIEYEDGDESAPQQS